MIVLVQVGTGKEEKKKISVTVNATGSRQTTYVVVELICAGNPHCTRAKYSAPTNISHSKWGVIKGTTIQSKRAVSLFFFFCFFVRWRKAQDISTLCKNQLECWAVMRCKGIKQQSTRESVQQDVVVAKWHNCRKRNSQKLTKNRFTASSTWADEHHPRLLKKKKKK